MPNSNEPTRVAAIVEPGGTQEQIIAALASQPEFRLVDVLADLEKLSRDLRVSEPQIVLVDHQIGGQPTLDIIDDIALQFPEVAIVSILPGENPLAAQQVMLAGARAFIIQPFTQVNLLSTLRRVRDLESRRIQALPTIEVVKQEEDKPLKTIAVYTPRGVAGCSTLALNLGIALHEEMSGRVLLVEGKLFFGHLDVLLNVRSRNTLADLIPHAANLDPGLIGDVIVQHASGLHLLMGPNDVQVAQGIRAQDLFNVVEGLKRQYDYLVIDAGSDLNENTVTLLDAADRILLVANPDMAALHDVSRFIQISRSLAYPPGKLLVVLNRAGMPGGIKTKDIESALHHEVYAMVPDDSANALRSLNRGLPMLYKYPRSPASRGFQQLAKRLASVGAQGPEQSARPSSNGKVHARLRPGRKSKETKAKV